MFSVDLVNLFLNASLSISHNVSRVFFILEYTSCWHFCYTIMFSAIYELLAEENGSTGKPVRPCQSRNGYNRQSE